MAFPFLFKSHPMNTCNLIDSPPDARTHGRNHAHIQVPSRLVDLVWHAHVLHTHQYIQDCHSIFGQMFWHFPEYALFFSIF